MEKAPLATPLICRRDEGFGRRKINRRKPALLPAFAHRRPSRSIQHRVAPPPSSRRGKAAPSEAIMLPSHTITTFALSTINAGHPTVRDADLAVGAATLTVRVAGGKVSFDLSTFILRPMEPPENLLAWIENRLGDEQATLSVYWPNRVIRLLSSLPGAAFSPAIRGLSGKGKQPIIRLQFKDEAGFMPFDKACGHVGIPCASTDAMERFVAWCNADIDQIAVDAEADAIALWKMTIDAIERKSGLGVELATVLRRHLALWLRDTDRMSTRIHQADLGQTLN
ncbi:hypothetical protein [Sphingobium yanoikuyae]|uniref:hypothetical protein n=2 Tax=Sphingomonadaceae TaxID=41297 RepID=UPI001377EB73|nr:hypothetical protein [Sphingobium yanoikuyae]NBB40104.1 hypothetical protein [Sphingobium yanoikuyae]